MPKAAYCSECGRVVWLTETGCENGHPMSCVRDVREVEHPGGVTTPGEPLAAAVGQPLLPSPIVDPIPLPVPERDTKDCRFVLRSVLWSVYALPVIVVYLMASLDGIVGSRNPVYAADLAVSLPAYAAVLLHAWDRCLARRAFWRAYAFAFVAWQVAFALAIEPALRRTSLHWPNVAIGFAIQLPMLVALFRYSFRRWPASQVAQSGAHTTTITTAKPKPNMRVIALSVVAGILGVLVLSGYGAWWFAEHPEMSLANMMRVDVYDVSSPPPARPERIWSTTPRMSAEEAARLRGYFDKGDFDALNEALAKLQLQFERDPRLEGKLGYAFGLFSGPSDGKKLDAWVSRSPAHFAPYAARAAYQVGMAWIARGDDWAGNTSPEQFTRMHACLGRASADVESALRRNPRLLVAHLLRMKVHMGLGEHVAQDTDFEVARKLFPHSLLLYDSILFAARPRWGGSYEGMERIVGLAVKDNRGNPAFYAFYGRIYQDQAEMLAFGHRYRQAVELYTKALAYEESALVLQERGDVYFELGDAKRALADTERGIALNPDLISARLLRATLRLQANDYRGAIADLKAAKALAPGDKSVAEWEAWAGTAYGVRVK